MGLQVVLLPLAQDGATDGMGGMGDFPNQPLVLEVISVVPTEPPWESGETFDLTEPAGYVRAGNAREDELPGYVEEAEEYGVAKVALLQGAEILAVYRGLYHGTTESVGPRDPCVK